MGERWNKCVILEGGGTTVRVLRFSLCKIIKFNFIEKKFRYLIVTLLIMRIVIQNPCVILNRIAVEVNIFGNTQVSL